MSQVCITHGKMGCAYRKVCRKSKVISGAVNKMRLAEVACVEYSGGLNALEADCEGHLNALETDCEGHLNALEADCEGHLNALEADCEGHLNALEAMKDI